ncbi:MAG: DNA repair protein RecO [Candidatus Omnitrophota bacterium]|jgi:DNA repair protein RecO (recombination protein O)
MVTKDLGFVMKRHNFRETSIIASFYTKKFGKITGILKGFYTFKKEFSSSLDLFTLNELIFYPKKSDIWLVSFADLVRDYDFLRKNINAATAASVFINLTDRALGPWDKNPEVFNLIKEALSFLQKENVRKVLYVFLVKFLTLSGFKPEFGKCLLCHKPISEETFFSVLRGGLICKKCSSNDHDLKKISREAIASIFYIQNNDFIVALRLKPTEECEKEVMFILREFLCYHLEFDVFGERLQ